MIDLPVESVLTRTAPTVAPDTYVTAAAEMLRDPTVPALVVLDDEDDVTGIVTESDIVAMVAEQGSELTVEEIMSGPVITIPPSLPMTAAADRMRSAGVKQLPVVEDGAYSGLVTRDELTPYLSSASLDVDWVGEPLALDADAREDVRLSE